MSTLLADPCAVGLQANGRHSGAGRVQHMKQSVALTGLGLPLFADCLSGINALRDVMVAHLGHANMSDWEPTMIQGYPVIHLSNRYLSTQQEALGQDQAVMTKDVDPMGILGRMQERQNMVHVQDNVVEYYERRANERGQ